MTSDQARLAQIQARVEKATGGTWTVNPDDYAIESESSLNGYVLKAFNSYDNDHNYLDHSEADMEFVLSSRADIPFLLDLISRWTPVIEASKNLQRAWIAYRAGGEREPLPVMTAGIEWENAVMKVMGDAVPEQ